MNTNIRFVGNYHKSSSLKYLTPTFFCKHSYIFKHTPLPGVNKGHHHCIGWPREVREGRGSRGVHWTESAAVDTLLERALWHWVPELLLPVRRYLLKGHRTMPKTLFSPFPPSTSPTISLVHPHLSHILANLLTSLTSSRKFNSTSKS